MGSNNRAYSSNGVGADLFPRLRWQVIAPSGSVYATAAFQQNAGIFNIVDFGPYIGIEQNQGATFATIFQNIKAIGASKGITTRCLHYTNSSNQSATATSGGAGAQTNGGTYYEWTAALNTNDWWLRAAPYPSGAIVVDTFGASDGSVMNTSSQNTVLDGSGRTFAQGYWNHYDTVLRQGGAASLGYASGALAANPYLDGYQMDNVFCTNRSAGAWQNNSTSFAIHNASVATWLQQGQAAQIAALKAVWPNALVMGNSDFFLNTNGEGVNLAPGSLDPSIKGALDMVYCQVAIGPNGLEQFAGTTAAFMQGLINAEALMSASGTLIFEQSGPSSSAWTSTSNQALWTATDWQAARYGMACACMRNWHYNMSFSTSLYGPTNLALMDEFGPQRSRRSWLGSKDAADAPQSAARTSGVWWRKFPGGVVFMNPEENTQQTISLSSIGLSGLSAIASNGFGDNTINTGSAVTSITLQPRDGRFLMF